MKKTKQKLFIGLVALSLCGTAQNGMDYVPIPFQSYSRLRSNFLPFLQNQNNEKALGVYQSNFTPQSFLEVNSTPLYMPFPMPGVALGEVFRTTSPLANNAVWRMFTGTGATAEKFNITIPANSSSVTLQATNGSLILKDSANQITLTQIVNLKTEVEMLKIELTQLKKNLTTKTNFANC